MTDAWQQIEILAQKFPAQDKKIVLVTGVFDILHHAHKKFLTEAKKLGDVLLVGLESDARVRQIKGEGRPVNSQNVRQQNLEKLHLADAVFILPEDFSRGEDHEKLIKILRPKFLAVSSHTAHLAEKQKILAQVGGQVKVVLPQDKSISTTKIIASTAKKL